MAGAGNVAAAATAAAPARASLRFITSNLPAPAFAKSVSYVQKSLPDTSHCGNDCVVICLVDRLLRCRHAANKSHLVSYRADIKEALERLAKGVHRAGARGPLPRLSRPRSRQVVGRRHVEEGEMAGRKTKARKITRTVEIPSLSS